LGSKHPNKYWRTLDEQWSEASVAGLADPQLLIDITRLTTPWYESEICANIS
jgi:hypothetical protein